MSSILHRESNQASAIPEVRSFFFIAEGFALYVSSQFSSESITKCVTLCDVQDISLFGQETQGHGAAIGSASEGSS